MNRAEYLEEQIKIIREYLGFDHFWTGDCTCDPTEDCLISDCNTAPMCRKEIEVRKKLEAVKQEFLMHPEG